MTQAEAEAIEQEERDGNEGLMPDRMTCEEFKRLRLKVLRLKQTELAELLGVSASQLCRWERGRWADGPGRKRTVPTRAARQIEGLVRLARAKQGRVVH